MTGRMKALPPAWVVFASVCVVGGVTFGVVGWGYGLGSLDQPGPGALPVAAALVLVVAILGSTVARIRDGNGREGATSQEAAGAVDEHTGSRDVEADGAPVASQAGADDGREPWRVALAVAGLAAYAYALPRLGFGIAAAVMVFVLLSALGYGNKKRRAVVAVIATVAVGVAMSSGLGIPLPSGPFGSF